MSIESEGAKIGIDLVKEALGVVRRTGKYGRSKSTSDDFKRAVRMLYHNEGVNAANEFLSSLGKRWDSIMPDARYGFDEVDYPKGAAALPPGTLTHSPSVTPPFHGGARVARPVGTSLRSDVKQAARAQELAQKRAARYGPRG